jgi:hypothetical protein
MALAGLPRVDETGSACCSPPSTPLGPVPMEAVTEIDAGSPWLVPRVAAMSACLSVLILCGLRGQHAWVLLLGRLNVEIVYSRVAGIDVHKKHPSHSRKAPQSQSRHVFQVNAADAVSRCLGTQPSTYRPVAATCPVRWPTSTLTPRSCPPMASARPGWACPTRGSGAAARCGLLPAADHPGQHQGGALPGQPAGQRPQPPGRRRVDRQGPSTWCARTHRGCACARTPTSP